MNKPLTNSPRAIVILLSLFVLQAITTSNAKAEDFDHSPWNDLLQRHVSWTSSGKETQVDYQSMAADRPQLKQYLESLSKIELSQFDGWSENRQLAFLINAYNAWTVELILTAWPDLKSIKDLGSFFRSPWSKKFIPLLGTTRSLDNIEHDLIRGSGRYNDPRIHFAVNCASIGCPPLRPEAYLGNQLEEQLNQQAQRFLSNPRQNRFEDGIIKLSSIFKWYREDFEQGWLGYQQLEEFLVAHAADLNLPSTLVEKLRTPDIKSDVEIEFLDYDWRLNNK